MTRWPEGFIILGLLLSLSACAPRPSPSPVVNGVLLPSSAEDVLAPFDRRWQKLDEIRSLARVTVTSREGRFTTRQTFLWHRPSLLRFDAISLFGQPTMSVVADATRVSVYYPAQGTFFQGIATATNLARFIGLPLAPADIVHLLTGYIRPGPETPITDIRVQADNNAYLLRFLQPARGLFQDAWVDPGQWLPTRVVRYTTPTLAIIDILYSDFRLLAEDLSFPFQLVIWLPRTDTEIRIQFLSVELNPGLALTVFQLSPPEGMPVSPLE